MEEAALIVNQSGKAILEKVDESLEMAGVLRSAKGSSGCIIGITAQRVDRIKAPGANYKGDDQVARKLDALPADLSASEACNHANAARRCQE